MAWSNKNKWATAGTKYSFWGNKIGNYVYGSSTSVLGSGEDSGGARIRAVNTFNFSRTEANKTPITGDNGTIGVITSAPTGVNTGGLALGMFNQLFVANAEGQSIVTKGDSDISAMTNSCVNYRQMILVINSPAIDDDGAAFWETLLYLNVQAEDASPTSLGINTATDNAVTLTFNESAYLPWGQTLQSYDASFPATAIGLRFTNPYPRHFQTYVGDGASAQTVTLDYAPAAADGDKVEVWEDGTALAYTTNYSVSTTTKVLTFVGTDPADAAVGFVWYQFNPDC